MCDKCRKCVLRKACGRFAAGCRGSDRGRILVFVAQEPGGRRVFVATNRGYR